MTRDEWLNAFNSAPPAVQTYLLEPTSSQGENNAQTLLAYENDAWDRVMDAVWELIFKKQSRQEFSAKIKTLAGDRKPEDVERAVLQQVVLPLADLLTWDVETRLQELGVPASEIQNAPRVSLRPVSYGAAARRIASNAKISILSEDTVRKLRDVIVSYLKGVRAEEQVKEILQRQQAEGGLGFAKNQAEALFNSMTDFLATTQVMSEQDYASWFQNFQREANADQAEAASKGAVSLPEGVSAAEMPRTENTYDPILGNAVQDCLKKIGAAPATEQLQKRLANIVSTRLRDVRNAVQTRAILEREDRVGGMGFAPDEAARISGIIEAAYNEHRASIETEEKQRIQSVQEEQKKKIEERKQRESAEHAAWYREKVQNARGDAAVEQLRTIMTQQPQTGVDSRLRGNDTSQKQTMQDIVPPQRLSGLAEELGSMDIEAFRRQSKSPEQAAEKVFQKLESLKRESFERWTEGIESWRKSPLQQQYLKLVTESFTSARPVAELVEEKRKTDPKLPTADELGAIISLNARIQY